MASRTVYPDAELAGAHELTQPIPVDGSSYTEPVITALDTFTYTAEDDAAAALQTDAVTIPTSATVGALAVIVASVADETNTTAVATAPAVNDAVNEIQTLDSTATGGTFTLTFGANTTAALNSATATAAQVQTELDGLASIGVGNSSVTGGPFASGGTGSTIFIEFTGTLAGADQALITVNDSSTGGTVVAAGDTAGAAATAFTSLLDINVPQAGTAGTPQTHVWSRVLTSQNLGATVDVTFSNNANNRSLAAVLFQVTNPDGTPLDATGTEDDGGANNLASFGSITPATVGAKIVPVLAKALSGAGVYYTTNDPPSAPAGYPVVAECLSDAMTLDVYKSGVADTSAVTPPDSQWNQNALWSTGSFAIQPSTAASSGATLYEMVDSQDESTWIDITDAAGSMYEILEFDLSTIPAGAVFTQARLEVAHRCSVRNLLRVTLIGINADSSIVPFQEQQSSGYPSAPVGQIVQITTAPWQVASDGTPISDFARLGIALISSSRHPDLQDHHILWTRMNLTYDVGGPVVSAVAGPSTAGDPITWTYSSTAGLAQSHYQIMVIAGSAQDPDTATTAANPLDAAAGEIVYDSGQLAGVLTRSVELDAPLGRGTNTVAVRAWATTTTGLSVRSAWDSADFDITGTPVATGTQSTEPVYNDSTGGMDVEVVVPASVSRAWLLRSNDSGTTWEVTEGSPFTVTPSTTETLTDYYAPLQSTTLRYQVTFDAGVMTETGAPEVAGAGVDASSPAAEWWFRVTADDTLNQSIRVVDFSETEGYRAQAAEQEGRALVASSPALAVRLQLTIECLRVAERQAFLAVMRAGLPITVSDIWGRSWLMSRFSALEVSPRKSKGTGLDPAQLKDLRRYQVTMIGQVVTE